MKTLKIVCDDNEVAGRPLDKIAEALQAADALLAGVLQSPIEAMLRRIARRSGHQFRKLRGQNPQGAHGPARYLLVDKDNTLLAEWSTLDDALDAIMPYVHVCTLDYDAEVALCNFRALEYEEERGWNESVAKVALTPLKIKKFSEECRMVVVSRYDGQDNFDIEPGDLAVSDGLGGNVVFIRKTFDPSQRVRRP